MRASTCRLLLATASLAALLGAAPASAEPAPRNAPLAARGPVSPVHPLPLWYQDANGVQLEPCLDTTTVAPANPCKLTAGAGVVGAFDPALPIVYPTNFPAITQYHWLNTEVTTNNGGKVNTRGLVYTAEVVGAANGGLPAVYTHLRFDTNVTFTAGASYKITHPYGVFTLTVDGKGALCPANNKLCDIFFPVGPPVTTDLDHVLSANLSVNPNDVTVGAYLHDITPPAGFVGDGAGRVQLLGSPKATNFVRIEGPTTGPGSTDLGTSCTVTTAGTVANCAENIDFTILGRIFSPTGGPTARLVLGGLASGAAGAPQAVTVTATDVNGNTTTGYTGVVHFTSSDPLATLPADATLTGGVGTVQVTPRTAGTFVLTATDTVKAAVTASASASVTAGPVSTLVAVSGGGQGGATGAVLALPLVVRAADAFGNPTSGVAVTFASLNGGAVAPSLALTDATGQASTTATLGAASGAQSFTATATGVAAPVTFAATSGLPGVAVSLSITGLPAGTTAGASAPFTVTAFDAFGNLATLASGPAGALAVTSSDPGATLPALASLTLGAGTFGATFHAAGTTTLTVSLSATPSVTATASTLVSAGPAAALTAVSGGGQSGAAGAALGAPLVVKVTDAFGNARSGTAVAFASLSGGGVSPVSALTAANGTASAAATLGGTAGAQAFSATVAGLVGSPLSFAATATPGPAATLAVSGLAAGVTAGVSAGFTVTARDAFGNVATAFAGSVAFTSTDAAAVLPASATLAAGAAAFSATFKTAGAATLTATVVGSPAVTGSAGTTVAAAGAASLAIVSGGGQSGTVGQALGAPLVVRALDAFGNARGGVAVTFAATGGGAVAPASATTDAAGQASTVATLGGAVGAQGFTATSGTLAGSPLAFTATAAPGAATALSVAGLAATSTAGASAGFTVTARDAFGNVAAGFAGSVTFTSTDAAATLPAPATLASGSGAFAATFRTAGLRSLSAAVTGAPAVTGSASTTVAAAAAATLAAVSGGGQAGVVGQPLAAPLVVRAADAFGNPVSGVAVTFGGPSGGGVAPAAGATDATGQASAVATLGSVAGPQAFTAAAGTLGGSPVTFAATASPGPAASLAIGGLAAAVTAGAPAGFTVTVRDALGNVATGFAGTVGFSATDPAAVLPAAAGLSAGTGTFSVTFRTAGARSLTAAVAGAPAIAGTASTAVSAGAAASLSPVSGSGQSGVAGGALAAPLVVRVADAFGNPVAGAAVSFAALGGGSVTPGATTTTAAGTGSAAATLPPVAGAASYTATAGALTGSPVSFSATAVPGAPATLQLVGLPAGTTAGGAVSVTVNALDALGNPATNFNGALAFASSDGAALLPPTPALSLGSGSFQVTFHTAGVRTLTATLAGTPGATTTGATTVAPGAPASLSLAGLPASTVAGVAVPVTVAATDAFGNACTNFSGPLGLASTDPAAALPAGAALASGTGAFSLTLKTAGARAVTASLGSPAISVTQPSTVAAAAAAGLAIASGNNQAGVVGNALALPLAVRVTDAFGNAVAGTTVTFAAVTAGASVTPLTAQTAADGTASTSGRLAATALGAQTFSATSALLTPPSVTFTATAQAGTPTSVALSGLPASVTAGVQVPVTVSVLDQSLNVASGYVGTVSFASTDPKAVLPAAVALVNGTGSFNVTFKTAGAQGLTVTASGATPFVQTASSAVQAAAPSSIAAVSGGGQTGVVHAALAQPFVVRVVDAFGNPAPGAPVTFTAPPTGAVSPSSASTAADGTASALGTLPSVAGGTSFGASVSGVAGGVSFAVNAAPGAPATLQLTGVTASSAAGAAVVVTVSAFDGQSPPNPASNFTGSAALSSSDPLAVLPPSVLLAGGTGTFQVTFGAAGARTVTATLAGPPPVSGVAATTVTAGAASGLALASGDGQAGTVGQALPAPLVVRVTDLFGNPVQGVGITFAAAAGSVSPASGATAADGTTSALATLGHASGPQAFTATAAGLSPASLTFRATAAPGPASSLVLGGLPGALSAGTQASVTVSVFDAFGNPATGFAGQVAVTSNDPSAVLPPVGTLTQGVGTFQVALRSTGTHSVTATAVASPALTDTRSTVVGPAAAATLAVTGSPGSTRVGQPAAAPLTVKVSDGLGNPVANVAVTFAATGGGSISPTTATTGADGTASATLTMGTVAQVYDFTATSGALAGSPAAVHVTAVADQGTHLALDRAAGPTAIDCGCYDLTARLQDQFGNTVAQGVPGVTVAVAAPAQAKVTSTDLVASGLPAGSATGTLRADGTALVRVCDQRPEQATVTVAATGFSGASLPLTWLLGPFDPAASDFASDTPVLAAFSGRAHVTVMPRSACGNPLGTGQAVTLGLAGPGSITATVGQPDGRYTATVDVTPCPTEASTQVTARVAGVDLAPLSLAVACVTPSVDQTLVTPSRATVVICDEAARDAVTVAVTPRDAAGAVMGAGNQVAVSIPGFTGGAVVDAGDGTYQASFTAAGCTAGPREVQVTVNGVVLGPPRAALDVSCAAVDAAASGLSVAGAPVVADGTSQVEVTVAAMNTCGVPARGRAVQLTASTGATLGAPTGTTDAAGTHQSWLTSTQAGTVTLGATVDGVALASQGVAFTAPPSKAGGGCASGGGAELPAVVLTALALMGAGVRRRRRA